MVAIKAIKRITLDDWAPEEIPALIVAIGREPVLLAHLAHPQIPRYYDHFEENDAGYLVMELVDGTELTAKITCIISQSYGPDVQVTFVNPHISVKEQRWINPSHLWKLSANVREEG